MLLTPYPNSTAAVLLQRGNEAASTNLLHALVRPEVYAFGPKVGGA